MQNIITIYEVFLKNFRTLKSDLTLKNTMFITSKKYAWEGYTQLQHNGYFHEGEYKIEKRLESELPL